MNDINEYSRVDKYKKRRKNTKALSILLVIGIILLVVLICIWIFGRDDEVLDDKGSAQNSAVTGKYDEAADEHNEESSDNGISSDMAMDEPDEKEEIEDNESVEIEPIESSDGDNVVKAYTGNWQPIGTEQEEPHTVVFDTASQDWREMEEAIRYATKLTEDQMITHWIGNDGEQKVKATVSNREQTEIYCVYLSWIKHEGWKPIKVEILNEVDVEY
ncbi:MAG TPA: YrrS family protein [Bacillota bacterium]|nr:YrrS family protein [Bacillota bacterium]